MPISIIFVPEAIDLDKVKVACVLIGFPFKFGFISDPISMITILDQTEMTEIVIIPGLTPGRIVTFFVVTFSLAIVRKVSVHVAHATSISSFAKHASQLFSASEALNWSKLAFR
jgi:hypothetical protein